MATFERSVPAQTLKAAVLTMQGAPGYAPRPRTTAVVYGAYTELEKAAAAAANATPAEIVACAAYVTKTLPPIKEALARNGQYRDPRAELP